MAKRPTFKKSSLKTFSFFLFFSALIWVLVQFSKTYTQVIEIPVNYVNVPLDKSLSEDRPDHVDLQLQDNAFNIYYYKIFNPELTIDLSQASETPKNLVYVLENHLSQIEEQLKINFEKSRIIQDEILIPFQYKKEKVIKVVPRIDVNYAVGFSAENEVQIEPDSVKVSGPEEIIDTMEQVYTQQVNLNKVNSDIRGSVTLDTAGLGMLSFYTKNFEYSQQVEKFTEGSVEIPVEVVNVPEGLNLAYFPKTVMVYYQVNLQLFDEVNAGDFRVVCDYAEVKKGEDYMIAQVAEQPGFIRNVRLNERRIQFVIKR
ncbi:YbbR-like domain-containing protein [Gramella sp. BOM4]|nr:YbbR-like domain-containing protein [Christiangramia bathymodioli]